MRDTTQKQRGRIELFLVNAVWFCRHGKSVLEGCGKIGRMEFNTFHASKNKAYLYVKERRFSITVDERRDCWKFKVDEKDKVVKNPSYAKRRIKRA